MNKKSLGRWMIACFTAALMLGAIGSASASAAACTTKAGSGNFQLCINGASLTEKATVPISGRNTTALTVNLNSWAHETGIECSTMHDPGSGETSYFTDNPASAITLRSTPGLSGCQLTGSKVVTKKCRINTASTFVSQVGHLSAPGTFHMAPEAGSEIFEWELKNASELEKCVIGTGGHYIDGRYGCTLKEPTVEAVEHELQCATVEPKETYIGPAGENYPTPLSYKEMVSLSGTYAGKKFSIYESA